MKFYIVANRKEKNFLIEKYGELKNSHLHSYADYYIIDIHKESYNIADTNSIFKYTYLEYTTLENLITIIRDYEINKII